MKNFYRGQEYSVIIPSHRKGLALEAKKAMRSVKPVLFLNDGYSSFSKLINDAILKCEGEICIICNDKARPSEDQVYKMLTLISSGFGFVGLHNFRFFGFHLDLVRKIGWFDERYTGGEFEDFDYFRRIKEADIAAYMSKEVACVEMQTGWDCTEAKKFNFKKWEEHVTHTIRLMKDEKYDYDIGPEKGSEFLPYVHTVFQGQEPPLEFK